MKSRGQRVQDDVNYPIVYLYEIGILGQLLQYNAHMSLIRYELDGIRSEVLVLNEDFEIIQQIDLGLDYE